MTRHWTEAQITEALSGLKIVCDTREQVNDHIEAYFKKKKIPCISRKIDTGDYSAQLGDLTLEKSVVVERKRNIDEICGNFTADRDRFNREFMRAKAYGIKVFLIIENASWDDIYLHNYRSKLKPQSLIASLMAWQVRFNVTVIFSKPENTPKIIHGLLYYAAREQLIYGETNTPTI